jgi:hypothetical protein
MSMKFTKIAAACTLALAVFGPVYRHGHKAPMTIPAGPEPASFSSAPIINRSTAAAAPRSRTTSNA